MSLDFLYDLPNAIVLLIFIVVLLAAALIGLYIFTILTSNGFSEGFNDQNSGTALGVISTALAIIIAFIITNEYQIYSETSSNLITEANTIYSLIQVLVELDGEGPGSLSEEAILYLCSIQSLEFPDMSEGIMPPDNIFLDSLQGQLLAFDPQTEKQFVLYSKALDLLNETIALRNSRLEQVNGGLAKEFWWLLIIGFAAIVALSWFLKNSLTIKILLVSFITVIYSVLIFLVFILDNPYLGDFSLNDSAFVAVTNKLGITCPTITNLQEKGECCDTSKFLRNRIAKISKCNTCPADGI